FHLNSVKPVDEYLQAERLGVHTRPVLLGPVSFVLLGKFTQGTLSQVAVLEAIVPIYRDILRQLREAGADWVQIDEPCLVLDLDTSAQELYRSAYRELLGSGTLPSVLLATYFAALGSNLQLATDLSTDGLHIDLVRAPEQLHAVLKALPAKMMLSLGIIDGRNIWRSNLGGALTLVRRALEVLGGSPDCPVMLSFAPSSGFGSGR